ncbi:hypothetical protein P171DRAFT_156587 [Karstenula rhodostoma CBS 690.94]|uniref:Uncharacterized protein n=1 Tax=Karstenula rhodostoma CBS 690.94 TaxID=1392251 RepID=A0A9P4P929_9PLEO|nr:hypothetical protein P171DRAFT_156587 [Karstenula rhodostoma CBS 690.94]
MSDDANTATYSTPSQALCYFSLPVTSTHFSIETPGTTPLHTYSPDIRPDPHHPLLASRHLSPEHHMASDHSSLLQLQTSAANRPAAQPLQEGASSPPGSASSSSSGSTSPSTLCCSRCRRESGGSMVQFGTNIYYCSHCARMTGYCAG